MAKIWSTDPHYKREGINVLKSIHFLEDLIIIHLFQINIFQVPILNIFKNILKGLQNDVKYIMV